MGRYWLETLVEIPDPTTLEDEVIEVEVRIEFEFHKGYPGTYYDPPEPDTFEVIKIELSHQGKYGPCPVYIEEIIDDLDLRGSMQAEVNAYYD